MAEKISNSALALLVTLAIVVSIVGTWTTLAGSGAGITGYAGAENQSGNAYANVLEQTDIALINSTVQFGTVDIGSTHDTVSLGNNPDPFLVENQGSINADITVEMNASIWTSTTDGSFEFKCGDAGSYGCAAAGSQDTYTAFTVAPKAAITDLPYSDASSHALDRAELDVKIVVPSDEPSGSKASLITFRATTAA